MQKELCRSYDPSNERVITVIRGAIPDNLPENPVSVVFAGVSRNRCEIAGCDFPDLLAIPHGDVMPVLQVLLLLSMVTERDFTEATLKESEALAGRR
jgi:hypothetical protein